MKCTSSWRSAFSKSSMVNGDNPRGREKVVRKDQIIKNDPKHSAGTVTRLEGLGRSGWPPVGLGTAAFAFGRPGAMSITGPAPDGSRRYIGKSKSSMGYFRLASNFAASSIFASIVLLLVPAGFFFCLLENAYSFAASRAGGRSVSRPNFFATAG